jgi:hypothetical protein
MAVNVYLLERAPKTAARKTTVEVETTDLGQKDPSCAAELEKCRRASAGLVLGLWGNAVHAAASASSSAPPPPTPPPVPSGMSKREAMCQVARDSLRQQWMEKKDAIASGLTFALGNPTQQREDAERDAQHVAESLGVSGRARRDFVDSFVDARLQRLSTLQQFAPGSSMDWHGLLDGAHTLFSAEDAVVERQLGADALPQFQADENAKRLTILSMLATYADADWDEAIGP